MSIPPSRTARLVGATALALAAIALKWGLFDQLAAAERGEPVVRMAMICLLAAPGFGILGVLLVIFGDAEFVRRYYEIEGEDRVSPRVLWLVFAGMIPGVALYMWLLSALARVGYQELRP